MTVDSENTDLIEAEKVIVELLPNPSDRTIVLKQLLSSADMANSIAPNAWAVTLFRNGFRLNVGQVETLVFTDGKLKANLVGSVGAAPFIGPAFVSADYRSLPQPLCAFHGTVNEYGVLEQSLRPSHDQFIRLAASTSSGRPRKGTPFRSSHCEELMQYARNTVSAAESSDMNDYKSANLFQFCVYTIVSRDVLDAAALERKSLLRIEQKPWTRAKEFLDNAAKAGSRLPILLADAKDCSRLLYWGFLKNVEIVDRGTNYEVDQLRPLRGAHTPQELLLASSGKFIAPNFIKPYALCLTPAFLKESPSKPEDETFIFPEEGFSPETLIEGAAIRVTVNSYERNVRARRKCIEYYGSMCSACGFDFEGTYGEIGSGFIHVHHVKPLAEIGERYKVDPIRDLRPVCPNCHAMLHRQSPAISIEELKGLLEK